MTIRSAAMIVNAQSRKGRAHFRQACAALSDMPYEVDAHAVEDPARLNATVAAALAKKPDLLILGGGDGTISGLVDQLVGTSTALAVLPLGTANSFARTLGIPLPIEGAVDVIRTGRLKRIDLGMIDGDYFAGCAAIGLSPQIAQTVPHGLKKVLGRVGYAGWAALQYTRFEPFTLIVGDGESQQRLPVLEVRIFNGRFHGGTQLTDEARIDSGEILVQAVVGDQKSGLLKNWAANLMHLETRYDTIEITGTSIRVATEPPLPISIDGEVLATTPVSAHVAAGVIDMMVPA